MEVIPTVVPTSFDDVRSAAERYAFVPKMHIDVGDGRFVPNITWMPEAGDELPSSSIWSAHLMTESPEEHGLRYVQAGAASITAHIEAFTEGSLVPQAFSAWRSAGAVEVGLAVKINTPLERISALAPLADVVIVMTIEKIGTQGSPFDTRGIVRIKELHAAFPNLTIAADGGVNESNCAELARAGAGRLYVGSALADAHDPQAVYRRLLDVATAVH